MATITNAPTDLGIKMRIMEVDSQTHCVVVRYFSDVMTEEVLAVKNEKNEIVRRPDGVPVRCVTDRNVQITTVPAPQGTELLDYLWKASPPNREMFKLHHDLHYARKSGKVDLTMNHIKTMVNAEHPFVVPDLVEPTERRMPMMPRTDAQSMQPKVKEF